MIDHRAVAAGWDTQLYWWGINTMVPPPIYYSADSGPKG